MAKMTGFIFQDRYEKRLENLSDQEVGRLVRALVAYHARGERQELKGREQGAYDFIKADIDDDEAAHEEKCLANRKNAGKRTIPNASERCRTQANADNSKQTQATVSDGGQNININHNIKEKQEKEKPVDDDYPFGLTEDDVQASLELDRRIEDAARDVGLTVSVKALDKARELARKYGADELIQAIGDAYDKPSWPYVIGILKRRSEEVKAQLQPSADDSEAVNWYDG